MIKCITFYHDFFFPFCLFINYYYCYYFEKIFVNSLDFWGYYIVITKFLSVHCWISTNFLRRWAILGPNPNLGLVDSTFSFTQNPWFSLHSLFYYSKLYGFEFGLILIIYATATTYYIKLFLFFNINYFLISGANSIQTSRVKISSRPGIKNWHSLASWSWRIIYAYFPYKEKFLATSCH